MGDRKIKELSHHPFIVGSQAGSSKSDKERRRETNMIVSYGNSEENLKMEAD